MAEELKQLIDKINQEGIKAAESKAWEIEAQAREEAQTIVAQAKAAAEKITVEAKQRVAKMEESSRAALTQAGRDLMLILRREINAILDKIISAQTAAAMAPEQLAGIISLMARECGEKKETMVITLSPQDKDALEKSFLGQLKDAVGKGVTLKSSDDIQLGFTISYDQGKSHFDFSNHACVEYISQYLKPKLSEILKSV